MDNQPYQPFQPTGQMNPQGGQQQFGNVAGSPAGNFGPNGTMGPTGPAPTARLVPVAAKTQKQNANLIWIILLIIASLVAVTFIGLFIWMFSKWDTAQNDVDSQINAAVATAVNEKAEEMENQFIEREKQVFLFESGVSYRCRRMVDMVFYYFSYSGYIHFYRLQIL